jgi:predicted helicase
VADLKISAKHPAIRAYYAQKQQITAQGAQHELAVREAFKTLLSAVAQKRQWMLVVEQRVEGLKQVVRPDGTLRDSNTLPRGYWEAKDTRDDLEAEIEKKFARGYPRTNIVFEDGQRAILIQDGARAGQYDLSQAEQVATLLERFFGYSAPNIAGFEQAVERFKQDTPELARGLLHLIEAAHRDNRRFQTAFQTFYELCQSALNPNISRSAVDEMLIQHLLTERLMRTVFDNPDFARRNAIAAEVETVIDALTSQSFSRKQFLGQLDYLYEAIEAAARSFDHFSEKQAFINTVYERFFQGYAVKVADTHGIVYTPQPIVDFMCAAVEEVLKDEFGLNLGDPQVCIIDPCTGTGNFIINLLHRMQRQNPAQLRAMYRERLFANEVLLLPYYVASLNIEHAYYELTGQYEPFEGLCFVDTLDLAEGAQMKMAFMTERNSQRVERQKQAPITVIIGNPPYNVGQVNENDNNKNRKYPVVDEQVRATYAKDSQATNRIALYDPYVKFFRWATDRLGQRDGIVCLVSNNSFVDQIAFDGMRQHLLQDFSMVYHLDLHGNVRQNPKLSGTTHNVFGIQVGVGITVAVRRHPHPLAPSPLHREGERRGGRLWYYRVPDYWRAEQKLAFLEEHIERAGRHNVLNTIAWRELKPDARGTWLVPENADEYAGFVPMGTKADKSARRQESQVVFKTFSGGVKTNRDEVVYDFDAQQLGERIERFIEDYNAEVDRYRRAGRPADVDSFVRYDQIKWSMGLKLHLQRQDYGEFDTRKVRRSLYRPFTHRYLFFDKVLNEAQYRLNGIFPTPQTEAENRVICLAGPGDRKGFGSLIADAVPSLDLAFEKVQCFPFYVYDADGGNRRENITDWALGQFRARYGDAAISKWDIFYYVYGLLHHPVYRTRYAANLKRELPRIPFAPDFWAFAEAGRKLADLHLGYESITPYPLEYEWKAGKPIQWRVEKMRLDKTRTAIQVNESLTLRGIPAEAFEYRLGNRSAVEWVIDQYQVKRDDHGVVVSDPNRYSDNERYIVELVGRVTQVSVETAAIVRGLPGLGIGEEKPSA